jgi:hypothetical protein
MSATIVTVLDRANRPSHCDASDNANAVLVEVPRPYGCLAVRVDRHGMVTLEAQNGEGEVLSTHEVDPDHFVHPPIDKEHHDIGDSGGG